MQWRIAYVRKRKLSVGRIFPKAEFFRKPNFSEIVKWHLFIWHQRKLCALTNAPPVQSTKWVNDYQSYFMLTVLPLRFSVDWTQDMIIVNWREVTENYKKFEFVQFLESRICPNIYRMFRSLDWTHDMIIVKWHLFIWHESKLCALTNAPPVQSTQTGQWLSTLFHASYSAAQVYVLHPGQFIFALSCRRRPFLQVLQST